jgi:hypothetical protein
MAHSKTPAPTTFDVTHTLASAKPATCGDAHTVLVAAYGDEVAGRFASASCMRLPRHGVTELKGHKAEKPVGLLTPKQRAARKASFAARPKAANVRRAKPATVVIDGVTYRVGPKVRPAVA